MRKNCPLCTVTGLSKLSNHLQDIHGIDGSERQKLLLSAEKYSMGLYYLSLMDISRL